MEALSLLAAMGTMLAAVILKVVTGRLIDQMKNRIGAIEKEKQETLNQLRSAQAQKQVAEKNRGALDKKLKKLDGKKSRLVKEFEALKSEVEKRSPKNEAM